MFSHSLSLDIVLATREAHDNPGGTWPCCA